MKTPLASIMAASTSLLNKPSQQAADARELLETIVQESERMNGMITNLLSVTRLESGEIALERQIEALDDLVFTALSRFSGRLSERDVTLDIPADLPVLSVDAVLIDHVLVNLLENALRYTPAASPIEIRGSTQQGEVWVEISDHGPGIPATERERVFDKFYRGQGARQNDGGTGLGLTICRAVVRAHGGSIEISSSAGGGATVRFNLPVADAPTFASPIIERRADA
jgi:two-component system sensor histidine kinase KdpD